MYCRWRSGIFCFEWSGGVAVKAATAAFTLTTTQALIPAKKSLVAIEQLRRLQNVVYRIKQSKVLHRAGTFDCAPQTEIEAQLSVRHIVHFCAFAVVHLFCGKLDLCFNEGGKRDSWHDRSPCSFSSTQTTPTLKSRLLSQMTVTSRPKIDTCHTNAVGYALSHQLPQQG
jgi:hypothetical protein